MNLVDEGGNVLAEFTVNKKATISSSIINAKATRVDEGNAKISFETKGDSKITKVYYELVARTDLSTKGSIPSSIDTKTVSSVNVENGKVEDLKIMGLATPNPYDVYYIFEDEYGNISTFNNSDVLVIIPTDNKSDMEKTPEIASVTAPNLNDETDLANAKFAWTLKNDETLSSNKVVTTLYKVTDNGEEVVATYEGMDIMNATLDKFTSGGKNIFEQAGTYKLGVYVEGSEKGSASETVYSETVTVFALNPVRNVKVSIDLNGSKKVTWESDYNVDDTRSFKGYKVEYSIYDEDTKKYGSPISISLPNPRQREAVIPSLTNGKLYKITVTVEARDGADKKLSTVNSVPTESNEFFIITGLTALNPTENSVDLQFTPVKIKGEYPTYKVQVWGVNPSGSASIDEGKYTGIIDTQDVEFEKTTGKFTVKGLNSNTKYGFIVIGTTADGIEGFSNFVDRQTSAQKTTLDVTNLKVVSGRESNEGEICVRGSNGLSVNGIDYDNISSLPAEFKEAKNIVSKLEVGDIITIAKGEDGSSIVTVALHGASDNRDFSTITDLRGDTLILEGNGHRYAIKTYSSSYYAPKEVRLTVETDENDARFDINGINVDNTDGKLVLDGTILANTTAKKTVVIAKDAKVTFDNKVTINKPTQDVEMIVDTIASVPKFTVTPTAEENELTFESTTTGIEVEFSDSTTHQAQKGKVVIKANGKVTISATSINLESDLDVKTTDGDVEIYGENLKGSQKVNVTTTTGKGSETTLHVMANEVAPFKLNEAVIKKYTSSDVTTAEGQNKIEGVTVSGEDLTTSANVEKLNAYLKSFNLGDIEGATITVEKGSKDVTIVLPQNNGTENVTVDLGNLQQ